MYGLPLGAGEDGRMAKAEGMGPSTGGSRPRLCCIAKFLQFPIIILF